MQNAKHLSDTKSFRAAILIPFFISLSLFILIIKNNSLIFLWTYEGINNLLIIFKVPLGILALIIPFIAVINANHRSKQTLLQLKEANLQNTFSNYFLHKKEFSIYIMGDPNIELSGAPSHCKFILEKINDVHKALYGSMYEFTPYASDDKIKEISLISDNIYSEILKLNGVLTSAELHKISITIHKHCQNTINSFSLFTGNYQILENVNVSPTAVRCFLSYGRLTYSVKHILASLNFALSFSNQSIGIESISQLSKLNYAHIIPDKSNGLELPLFDLTNPDDIFEHTAEIKFNKEHIH